MKRLKKAFVFDSLYGYNFIGRYNFGNEALKMDSIVLLPCVRNDSTQILENLWNVGTGFQINEYT